MIVNRVKQFFWLLFVILISALGLFQMFMRTEGTIPHNYLVAFGLLLLVIVASWIVLAIRQKYASHIIFFCVLLLALTGITEIVRIDSEDRFLGSGPTKAGMNQIVWLILALVLCSCLAAALRNYRILRKFTYTSMVIGLLLMFSPLVPGLGKTINGARIWIGFGSRTVQPAEFAKLFIAIFFAGYLFDHRDQLAVGGKKFLGLRFPRLRDFGPILVVWAACMGVLVMQRDLGTALLFFAMFICMLYVATGHSSWILIGLIFFALSAFIASRLFGHVQNRITGWLHPFDPAVYGAPGGSEQLVTGIFGLAAGGAFGTGLGHGYPALTPMANSDFIYSSLGEELGLVGLLGILCLYLIIICAGIVTAMRIKDGFGKLLISGLVFTMAFQVFIVVGGITLVIPMTGLTLPFMAAGGSSLTANMLLIFLVLVISNDAHKPPQDKMSDTVAMEALQALQANERRREREEALRAQRDEDLKSQGAHSPKVIDATEDSRPTQALPLVATHQVPRPDSQEDQAEAGQEAEQAEAGSETEVIAQDGTTNEFTEVRADEQ